jgi:RNA polymerase sigma factor (sigma-70 family)
MAATAVPLRSRRRPRGRSLRPVGDERLVARVRAGDDDAFEAIYDRYYLGLLAFCRHMLGSRHEAEDALQHSFASAYRALRRGDSDVDLRPWLYTIARNRCLTALRSRRDEVDIDRLELEHGTFDGLPLQIQVRAELREIVEDLRRLPDDQRAALVLFELGDHSHDEIAAVLGVRREKVKALVFQARSGLLRAREARDASCVEIREQLSSLLRGLPKRGMVRAHVDRCDACAEFARDVRRQRSALAAILPVVPSAGLKASVLGFALGGGGGAAAITGVTVGGGAAAGGGVAALGTAGVATVAGGVVTSTTNVAPALSALGAKGLVTKLLTVVAVAGGTGEARHATPQPAAGASPMAALYRPSLAQASPALTVRRSHASAPATHSAPTRPSIGGPADPVAPLAVPAPEAAQADVTPTPVTTPIAQHPGIQPAAAPTAAPTSTPATDPPAAVTPTTPDPDANPAPATTPSSQPAATATATTTTTTTTAPTDGTTSTATPTPTTTTTTPPDPGPTASTQSTTEAPPAASAPATAAAEAQS